MQKVRHPLSTLEKVSLYASGFGLLAMLATAAGPLLFGKEMDCFPVVVRVLDLVFGVGEVAVVVGALGSLALAASVYVWKMAQSWGRLGGVVLSLLTVLVTSVPGAVDSMALVFSTHDDRCTCEPDGLLGGYLDPPAREEERIRRLVYDRHMRSFGANNTYAN